MKAYGILVLFLAGSLVARADDDTVTLPEMIQGAQRWAQENLDTNVLNTLPEVDERAVRQFFHDVQQRFQGDYVVDKNVAKHPPARLVWVCVVSERMSRRVHRRKHVWGGSEAQRGTAMMKWTLSRNENRIHPHNRWVSGLR